MVLPGFGALLVDFAAAVRAEDIVAEAEVFVQDEGTLGNRLEAVFAGRIVAIYC